MAQEMWNRLFERIDELEKGIDKKINTLEKRVNDTFALSLIGLDTSFIAGVRDRPSKARIIKDGLIKMSEDMGMSSQMKEALSKRLRVSGVKS